LASHHQGICYSGYRRGQNPNEGLYPTIGEIREDLYILARTWRHIRLYDSGPHAIRVLECIDQEGLPLEVMLGAYITAEQNNPDCPWGGGVYTDEQLLENVAANRREIARATALARRYPQIVTSVSAGNEATVDWTDHRVPVERVIHYVRELKKAIRQPVTFCENHVPWMSKLEPLVAELDFISLHTYPVWEYRSIEEAIAVTDADYQRIAARYPGKEVMITEAGWTTRSNGRGIDPSNASPELQARYFAEITRWGAEKGVRVYVFEAFDEPWKGSPDPDEPEKHWGLFTVDRQAKPAMLDRYPELRT
jgi:exo-beta-1,3-glucanase (GH17 family)